MIDLDQYKLTPPPGRLTEAEARVAGQTSNRLLSLRGMTATGVEGGSLTVKTRNGSQSLAMTLVDIEALIALLVERDEAILTHLDIQIDR